MTIKQMAAALGRKGGKVKSKAKAEAVRRNGKLGGRPRKEKKMKRGIAVTLVALAIGLTVQFRSKAQGGPNLGTWSQPFSVGEVGIHAALLATGPCAGCVIFWQYDQGLTGAGSPAVVWNPSNNAVTSYTIPWPGDMFCSATVELPNGNIQVLGGRDDAAKNTEPDSGITEVVEFNATQMAWQQDPPMANGRWYGSALTMANGNTLVASGQDSMGTGFVQQMEVWNGSTWATLPPSANIGPGAMVYPRLILLPSGLIGEFGMSVNNQAFNPATNTWASSASTPSMWTRFYGSCVLMPNMNQVMCLGGGATELDNRIVTNSASFYNFGTTPQAWMDGPGVNQPPGTACTLGNAGCPAPAPYPVENANLVLMPDGTVTAFGGGGGSGKYSNPIYTPQNYNPATNAWTVWAPEAIQRTYHSTAILLPSGQVVAAGSDYGHQDETIEVFSPPYMSAVRPVISGAPASLAYGQQFAFSFSAGDGSVPSGVSLLKAESTTHATRFDARNVPLTWSYANGVITATAPANGNWAPPGYYMLDVLDSSGVPAVMPFVSVGVSQ
jgi:hypothetical protein